MTLIQIYCRLTPALLALLLASCASTTRIDVESTQTFPSPLVEKTDVHMGIYIPDEFEHYAHEDFEKTTKKKKKRKSSTSNQEGKNKPAEAGEKASADATTDATGDRANGRTVDRTKSQAKATAEQETVEQRRLKFRIDLGEAQARMVRSVFPGVFRKTTMLDSTDLASMPADLDLFMVPSIQKVQYTTPKSTRVNVYEIWLQYVFTFYDRNGDVVARWSVPSYGKTPTAMMKSKESALHTATQMALRDCGAAFSTGFQRQPAVARWLQGQSARRMNRAKQTNTDHQQPAADPVQAAGVEREPAQ